jgi:methylmalonyl-CoA/ethylmalonyl-CoA epimerase
MKKIEHLGIAVKDINTTAKIYQDLFQAEAYKEEVVESEGVRTLFFSIGESKIELLQATNPDSPIAKFIEKRGEGIHHIAFEVNDIDSELQRLKSSELHFCILKVPMEF